MNTISTSGSIKGASFYQKYSIQQYCEILLQFKISVLYINSYIHNVIIYNVFHFTSVMAKLNFQNVLLHSSGSHDQ